MRLYLFVILFSVIGISCQVQNHSSQDSMSVNFLYKTTIDTSSENKGQHIEIKQILPKTNELIPMSIDDREIIGRSGYRLNEKMKILHEYLGFRGDTNTSNKRYHFKGAYYMMPPEGIEGFTVEIEALYSFTRMLTRGFPPIKPMLINRTTGERLNTDARIVNEVYDIYVKWYDENRKTDFQNITLPLSGSAYCWLGEDKRMELYMANSL